MTQTLIDLQAIKEADTQNDIHPLIRKRWSARAFSEQAIDDATMQQLFEAASWAPSSMNEQPWKYMYAHKSDPSFQDFFECLLAGNKLWNDNASVLILSLAQKQFSNNANDNRHAWHDVGAANTLLLLQAADLNIFGHQLGGFDREKTIETFNLPENLEPVCFISLGYLGDVERLKEPFKTREFVKRTRKNISEFVTRK
jgi:nitroreductase